MMKSRLFRRIAVSVGICTAIAVGLNSAAGAADLSGVIIGHKTVENSDPIVHLDTRWVYHPPPRTIRALVLDDPQGATPDSMNVGALVTCVKHGKKFFVGANYKHVSNFFGRTVRKYPVRRPKKCRVGITAVYDGTGPSCSGDPPTCFAQPGSITVIVGFRRHHPYRLP
jgi:hypothetical protein